MADTPDISPIDFLRGQIKQPTPDTLIPPKNIIQTVAAAQAIYFQYRLEHLPRIDLYAQIEGLIAGNPPYNPTELAQAKLDHIANFNNLEARSLYEEEALAFWNLLNTTQYLVQFEVRADSPDATKWAEIMSRHWTTVVREWESFNVAFNTLTGQLVKLGISCVLWPDEKDWRWRTIELSRLFLQDQAQTDIRNLSCICVESIFTAQYLMETYEQIKDKPDNATPWDKAELANLLMALANSSTKQNFQIYDAMDIQRHIQNGDTTYNQTFTDNIRIVSLLYQEYDGEVTHYMFHPYINTGTGKFLFKADRQYKCLDEGILIITKDPGEFTIHSNLGVGHKIFSASQAIMQLDCSVVDMAKMASTMLVQTQPTGAKDFGQIRLYPGIPSDIGTATIVRNELGENIQQVVGASQYTSQKVRNNLVNSGDDPTVPDKAQGSLSPQQSKSQDYKEFGLSKNLVAHFYFQFDKVVKNMTAKMYHADRLDPGFKAVEKWKRLCKEDGVPEMFLKAGSAERNELPDFVSVKAARAAGDGSVLGMKTALQDYAPMVSTLGPKGKQAYQRLSTIVNFGADYIETFLSDSLVADEARGGASLAGVENAIMQLGQSPVFSLDNEQEAHFVTHMALGNHVIEQIQQQQLNAIDADKIFSVLVPHMGEHWNALSQNVFEKSFVDSMKKPWVQLSDYARLNRKNAGAELQAQIKKQQEQQQKQDATLSDIQLKALRTNADIQNNAKKVDAHIQNASEANQNRAEIMREKVQEDAATSRMKVQLDHSVKQTEAQNKSQTLPLDTARQELADLNGSTPSPYDIEGTP